MQVHAHVLILTKCQAHQHYFLFHFYNIYVTPKMTESVNGLLRELVDAQTATQMQLTKLQQQVTLSQATSMKLVDQKIEEEHGYSFH